MKSNPKKNHRRSVFIAVIAGLSIFIISFLIMFSKIYADINGFFTHIQPQEQVMEVEQSALTKKLENNQPFSVLLIGTDLMTNRNTRGRADTLMVATINPQKESVKLVSIPRDTLISLPGTEEEIEDKINATYVYGYVPYLKETVEDLLKIPIDAYAILNYEGLIRLVDEVGGVRVNSDLNFDIKDDLSGEEQHIDEGRQTLNGREALAYARMRKEDPEGDYGRQKRQREIVTSLIRELISFDSFTNYMDILDALGDNVETNLTRDHAYKLFMDYRQVAKNVETTTIQAKESSRYFPHYGLEVFVFEPEFFPLHDLQEELRNHLKVEDWTNSLDENYDRFIDGFPLYKDNAVEELNLEEFVDPDQLKAESESAEEDKSEEEMPSKDQTNQPLPSSQTDR